MPVKKSVTNEYIISLEDGRKFKSMKRYLGLLGMTPADYRAKWGLPHDYPMVAPAYAAHRSTLAKTIGLGRKRQEEGSLKRLRSPKPSPSQQPRSPAAAAARQPERTGARPILASGGSSATGFACTGHVDGVRGGAGQGGFEQIV